MLQDVLACKYREMYYGRDTAYRYVDHITASVNVICKDKFVNKQFVI